MSIMKKLYTELQEQKHRGYVSVELKDKIQRAEKLLDKIAQDFIPAIKSGPLD